MSSSFCCRMSALLACALLSIGNSTADEPSGKSLPELSAEGAGAAGPAAASLTAADLGPFLDGLIPLQIGRDDIAGAVVSIVSNGQVLFARGYGVADVASNEPFVADTTLVRPGSVGKLFTWTAVMQQVELGRIDLDTDVNAYLDFKIPAAFDKPITMRHLMTHTPGFEEVAKGLFVQRPDQIDTARWLKTHIPRRIFPPGTVPAYSNYGAALAGYIVERVAGEPFNEYIERHLFKPLGMTSSTYQQPLPAALAPRMSSGYVVASDSARPFELGGAVPAGFMTSTATDMAKFMLAHLSGGRLDDAQILQGATTDLMHARQFAAHPQANGLCLGFYEVSRNGLRIIGHGGDSQYFHSYLYLIPSANVGLFISYNSTGRGDVSPRDALWQKFLDRYFPDRREPGQRFAGAPGGARDIEGSYMFSRRSESFLKPVYIAAAANVISHKDGSLEVRGLGAMGNDLNGKPKRWREIAPARFREVNGPDEIFFGPDATGRPSIVVSSWPVFTLQRMSPWEDKRLLLPIGAAALGIMLVSLVSWPIGALARRHYGRRLALVPQERAWRLGKRLVCAINLLFIMALAVTLATKFQDPPSLNESLDAWLIFLQVLGTLGALGAFAVVVGWYRSWVDSTKGWAAKLRDAILPVACLGYCWVVVASQLLPWSVRY